MHADAFVRRLPERNGARAQLRVEPAPGLVLALGDEVCRPEFPEIRCLCRESERSPRCDRRIEPDIEDIPHPVHLAAARARDRYVVYERAVGIGHGFPARLFEFRDGADDPVFVAFGADPDRDRDTPVTLPGDTPVAGLLDPVVEPGTPRPLGIPRNFFHFGEHEVTDLRGLQKPLRSRPENDQRLAAPAMAVP